MSRVNRRKHVLKEMMDDDYELPKEHQQIVRVVACRGNNLQEVESADVAAEKFLVSMPNKFRKNIWVKRGDFLLVEPIEEGDKVKAEICRVLTPEHVKEYTRAGIWPTSFTKKQENNAAIANGNELENDDDTGIVRNLNRPVLSQLGDDEDSDTDSDTSDE